MFELRFRLTRSRDHDDAGLRMSDKHNHRNWRVLTQSSGLAPLPHDHMMPAPSRICTFVKQIRLCQLPGKMPSLAYYFPPRRRGHQAIPRSVRLSVPWRSCPRRAAAAIGTQAACSSATRGLRTRPRTDVDRPQVEVPSAVAYRLAAPGAILCYESAQ